MPVSLSRVKRTQAEPLTVHLLREGIPESVHYVHATLTDERGRLLAVAGDAETTTFARSSFKPFQALAVVSSGTLEHFRLGDRDLAVICSSHQGQIAAVRQVFRILWQADIDPAELQCPIPPGKRSRLEHGCSGKHAGMLAVCARYGWPRHTYLQRQHPVQELILGQVGELLGVPGVEFIAVHDDCGAPTYLLQLHQLAALYSHLAAGQHLGLAQITRAMTQQADLVAGSGHFDTELMQLTQGTVVSKAGAEGVQCLANLETGMGLAIRVLDGARRAKYATAIHLLHQLGWISPTTRERLAEQFVQLSPYVRLEVQGELSLL
ncbi:MAG: asparaginase [Gloeomargarita sp. GMQP_bins_69]